MREERILWGGFALTIIAYLLPWVTNNGSGLTMGAYDFAEWLSKSSMYDSRIYNSVLALRGQLFLLTIFVAFGAKRPFFTADWWLRAILGILLIIAQLPALNMIPSIGVDVNRQQQVILAGLSFFALILGLTGLPSRWRDWFYLPLGIAAIATSLYGLINALDVMRAFRLEPSWGIGVIAYLGICFTLVVLCFFKLRESSFRFKNTD